MGAGDRRSVLDARGGGRARLLEEGGAPDDRPDARARDVVDGKPVPYWDTFDSESYRAQINMALDWAWAKGEKDAWEVAGGESPAHVLHRKGIGNLRLVVSRSTAPVIDYDCATTR